MSSNSAARIRELAALDRVAYERARREEAKRLGIRTTALDKAVAAARGDQASASEHLAELFPSIGHLEKLLALTAAW